MLDYISRVRRICELGIASMRASAMLSSLVTAAAVVPAHAQNWSGFYFGASAGMAWNNSQTATSATCGTNPPFYFDCRSQKDIQASGTGSVVSRSFAGGIQAGYGMQVGSLVYGAEADFGAYNLKSSRSWTTAYSVAPKWSPLTTSSLIEADWLATARGRIGFAATPDVLIYATGGLALTNVRVANAFEDDFHALGDENNRGLKRGWTFGGGVEWMIAKTWSVKAEYLHIDFGRLSVAAIVSERVGSPGSQSLLTTSSELTAQIARIGINYRY